MQCWWRHQVCCWLLQLAMLLLLLLSHPGCPPPPPAGAGHGKHHMVTAQRERRACNLPEHAKDTRPLVQLNPVAISVVGALHEPVLDCLHNVHHVNLQGTCIGLLLLFAKHS
jgi:hypothetical protein